MVESQKGTPDTDSKKKKNSLLDDEIGNEFLSSWKSMTVAEGDTMDFNCETVPKGGKKSFNFGKLDMDFTLDGDFDKISSFKVDMCDLDFSSPPKKTGKPKEKSENQSIQEKHQGKKDRFTFSFDFNDLDNFDLDSSFKKGERTSGKCVDAERSDSLVGNEGYQSLKTNEIASIDAWKDSNTKNITASEITSSSKFGSLTGSSLDLDFAIDNAPSPSAKFGNLNALACEDTHPKEITTSVQETNQQSQKSERKCSTGQDAQQIKQDSSVQSISGDDLAQIIITEAQEQVCASYAEANTNPGLESNNFKFGKKLESQINIPIGNTIGGESNRGDNNAEASSITNVSKNILHNSKVAIEKKDSNPELLASLQSESRVHKPVSLNEKVTGGVQSKYFRRLEESDSKLHPPSASNKLSSFGDKKIDTPHLISVTERQDFDTSDSQIGNQNVGTSASLDRDAAKALPVQESEKIDNGGNTSSSSLHVNHASKPERPTISTIPKFLNRKNLVSSMAPIRSLKTTPVGKNKFSSLEAVKKTPDFSSLKALRTTSVSQPNSTFQRDIRSLKHSEGNMECPVMKDVKIANSVGKERQTIVSPSLKRKTSEVQISNADPVVLNPLKRLPKSPRQSSKAKETLEIVEKEKACKTENMVDIYQKDAFCDNRRSSLLDVHIDMHLKDFELPVVMENDSNIEKAKACTKELEDICNMLKKKHEEAKEILVRAIVNNNELLMLNHPINEKKIRMLQKFSTQMMSNELQNQSSHTTAAT